MSHNPSTAPRSFRESSALIVGGTAGIGFATARSVLREGVPYLCIVGRNAARGESAVQTLEAQAPHAQVHYLQGNPIDPADATRLVQRAAELMGRIDLLVNTTAPEVRPDIFANIPTEDISRIFTHLALPSMHMCSAVLPVMSSQQSGAVVNVASDAGKTATPGETVIGAAKAAIIMFTRTFALEAKRNGIRANVVTPSLVADTLTGQKIMQDGFSAKLFEKAAQAASLGVSTAADQAELITFLLSPQAARLTGQAISANGGISAA